MHYMHVVEAFGMGLDGVGVAVIVIGAAIAAVVAVARLTHREANVYRKFRQSLGGAILLGLELLVAGDIIRTVATKPTLNSVAVLGAIVLIRTFLSFSLEVELTGHWPWRQPPSTTDRQDKQGLAGQGLGDRKSADRLLMGMRHPQAHRVVDPPPAVTLTA